MCEHGVQHTVSEPDHRMCVLVSQVRSAQRNGELNSLGPGQLTVLQVTETRGWAKPVAAVCSQASTGGAGLLPCKQAARSVLTAFTPQCASGPAGSDW